jgi:hypothetical protein
VVYPSLVSGSALAASLVNSLAWPAAVVVAIVLLRPELKGAFRRLKSFEFAGAKTTFAVLDNFEEKFPAAARIAAPPDGEATARREETEFSVPEALADSDPKRAVIDAWTLLEFQLNVASDRIAPDQPHGWPQVMYNLDGWDKWDALGPAVRELRQLRDYTVRSSDPPSAADATRYVTVTRDLATTLKNSLASVPVDALSGGNG